MNCFEQYCYCSYNFIKSSPENVGYQELFCCLFWFCAVILQCRQHLIWNLVHFHLLVLFQVRQLVLVELPHSHLSQLIFQLGNFLLFHF